MIGALSPVALRVQRRFADFRRAGIGPLATSAVSVNVYPAGRVSMYRSAQHQDHTPSPNGQQAKPLELLSDFSSGRGQGYTEATDNSGREPSKAPCVNGVGRSSEGTGQCPSIRSLSRLAHVPGWPLAATTLANRHWVGQPSAPVPLRSPAGRCCKVQRSVLRATSHIASSTPESAAATKTAAHPFLLTIKDHAAPRRARCLDQILTPRTAQPRLTRLFALTTSSRGTAHV